MTDMQRLAENYLAVWNTADADRRRALIAEVFTADAEYTDPLGAVRGAEQLDAFIDGARQQFAGMRFSLGSDVDTHHDLARFTWNLGPAGASEPVVIGFDVITVVDGKVRQVLGFLDKVPG